MDEQIRLQIPVHKLVFEELESLAKGFDRPISYMARELLEEGVATQENFLDWLSFRVIGKVLGNRREKLQLKNLPSSVQEDVVRIQVLVSKELNEKIEKLAEQHGRIPTHFASMTLVWTLDDQAWLIRFVQRFGNMAKAIVGRSNGARKVSAPARARHRR